MDHDPTPLAGMGSAAAHRVAPDVSPVFAKISRDERLRPPPFTAGRFTTNGTDELLPPVASATLATEPMNEWTHRLETAYVALHKHLLQAHLEGGNVASSVMTKTWRAGLLRLQNDIRRIIRHMPEPVTDEQAQAFSDDAYRDAMEEIAIETGTAPHRLPRLAPWTAQEMLTVQARGLRR